jgi:radical SAM protein (TIGR01212 family)
MSFYGKRYLDYSSFIKMNFGERVQKISLDTGFTCPNRDGSKGIGGCTYCNNNSFNPDYCTPTVPIKDQLERGMTFFEQNRKNSYFFAYFQAYTNTYADISTLRTMYLEALDHPKVIGLVIGTRPDCLTEVVVDFLSELAKDYFVALEFGIESTLNRTLTAVNRCHTFEDSQSAIEKCNERGFHIGAHLILGLPGETEADMLQHALKISSLPIHSLKLHHLQIIKHATMAVTYRKNHEEFNLFSVDSYIDLLTRFLPLLRPDIILERFISESPHHLLIAPRWEIKNFEFVALLDKHLDKHGIWQGMNYKG